MKQNQLPLSQIFHFIFSIPESGSKFQTTLVKMWFSFFTCNLGKKKSVNEKKMLKDCA